MLEKMSLVGGAYSRGLKRMSVMTDKLIENTIKEVLTLFS